MGVHYVREWIIEFGADLAVITYSEKSIESLVEQPPDIVGSHGV
ncbi:hypothetical protein [Specibacter sp. NPDC078692]